MCWKDKGFLVYGTGVSGIAAARLLVHNQAHVIVYDENDKLDPAELREKAQLSEEVQIVTGILDQEQWQNVMQQVEIAVLSPGVPTDIPAVEQLRLAGITIWGEIELAYVMGRGKVLAITGTNGKTTTTSLLGQIMKEAYQDVQVVGNIGIPYTGIAADTTEDTVVVAEISSFQLETVHSFCPQVSAILNITPDHLNRHHTMENYIDAKLAITARQGSDQVCVLNYEDPALRHCASKIQATIIWFSSKRRLDPGMYLEGDVIYWADGNQVQTLCNIQELQIFGAHNYENVMAAAAMAMAYGVPLEKIQHAVKAFQAVEHRIEYVATKRGVRFYNDSKGTNPDAAIQAIKAMQWPTLLIGGGYDKGSEYQLWIDAFDGKVKKFVLLGATREKIAETAVECGYPKEDILLVDSLEEAVWACYENAVSGDAVLLSPACASWGMFRNYEERGNQFKEMVTKLEE